MTQSTSFMFKTIAVAVVLLSLLCGSVLAHPLSPAEVEKRQDPNRCNRGNSGNFCEGVSNCPPCWIKNDGRYDCYDYTPEGKCPDWDGIWDRRASQGDKTSCWPGNQGSVRPCTKNCAPCWKNEGTYYSCFDMVGGKCPWPGMEVVHI
ncbi:hypothetical protein DFQ27_007028 [Actinomortierella ambigua]|uniref:Uncharacterized protein n=1 Tax=Actinomortierella ambigua TaxID=1343610 RepID=A0A9P6PXD9_9FUNG|nr:hypothetical protein DFQ27_007028 [Actinomortierella ambigua]